MAAKVISGAGASFREALIMLFKDNDLPLEIREAVNRYLSESLNAPFISTSAAIEAVRARAAEQHGVATRKLADYIAERAVEAGFAVRFDEREFPE